MHGHGQKPGQPNGCKTEFDRFAATYDDDLGRGLSLSGETKDFFARGRVAWISAALDSLGARPETVMDFGCGDGSTSRFLLDIPGVRSVHGVDISEESVAIGRREFSGGGVAFSSSSEYEPRGEMDLVYSNGTFHHIPPAERADALSYIVRVLKPGGVLSLWENNPWNPGTRLVMSRVPFDRDAILISARQARRLLEANGFQVLQVRFAFVFPAFLGVLRPLEPSLSPFPLGAQYHVLARTG